MNRREALGAIAAAGVAGNAAAAAPKQGPLKVSVFSKHLQWAEWEEMAAVAKQVGFDGIDLTVRAGGHVEPARVQADLPKVASIVRKAGLELPMITAGIVDAESPHAEAILETAAGLGIPHYRWGGFRFEAKGPLPAQLEALQPKVAKLEALNRKYKIGAMYHTHSGPNQVGAAFWDLWLLLKDHDPSLVGVNFDVGHATIEGGLGDWVTSFRLLAPFTRGTAVKDFRWEKDPQGRWKVRWCPIGEGMVDFPRYFNMLKESGFQGPLQIHYEYDEMGGADAGKRQLTITRQEVIGLLGKDLAEVRRHLAGAGLA